MRRVHRGLTLVEAVVALGILVLFAGVIIPWIVRARETARQAQCKGKLAQIGLALLNYHATFDTLPPGWVAGNQFGWSARTLPFSGEYRLYNRLNFDAPWTDDTIEPATILRHFRCPTDSGSEHVRLPILTEAAGRSNYAAVSGATPITDETVIVSETHGAFGENSTRNFRDFKDGLSYSVLVGERVSSGGPPQNPGGDTIWVGIRDNHSQQGQALAIGDCSIDNLLNFRGVKRSSITGFSSHHAGGAHFVLGDGSVRFISENIDPTTYSRLATIDDGQKLGDY